MGVAIVTDLSNLARDVQVAQQTLEALDTVVQQEKDGVRPFANVLIPSVVGAVWARAGGTFRHHASKVCMFLIHKG